ncbi:MAG: phenylalanine--tRNA ligase subunit alpha [Candidatus Dojkabacteria bacterium]|nr:MAG: phenylalanine--tRNA ligase subunit alpha [Candidatus Dojkabacteria bacterium]
MEKSEISSVKKQFDADVKKLAGDSLSIEAISLLRNSYTGKDSQLAKLFKELGTLDSKERGPAGKELNVLKQHIEESCQLLEEQYIQHKAMVDDEKQDIDLTAPFATTKESLERLQSQGASNPVSEEVEKMLSIFRTMGFHIFEARELDTEYFIFDSLNFPPNHPARENWDAFKTAEGLVPTPHTSNMQVRVMRYFKKPPVRAVIYGRCFRNEAVDVVHGHTFHQIEGLYVDKGVSVADMIGTIKAYLEAFFEQEIVWRIQPSFFPFVEPGIEFMVRCIFCKGVGCGSCKHSGWLEVAGAGMIHPNVLREAGIDPDEYTGFAWGLGLDRTILQKNGIKDIRSLFASDIRFLRHDV